MPYPYPQGRAAFKRRIVHVKGSYEGFIKTTPKKFDLVFYRIETFDGSGGPSRLEFNGSEPRSTVDPAYVPEGKSRKWPAKKQDTAKRKIQIMVPGTQQWWKEKYDFLHPFYSSEDVDSQELSMDSRLQTFLDNAGKNKGNSSGLLIEDASVGKRVDKMDPGDLFSKVYQVIGLKLQGMEEMGWIDAAEMHPNPNRWRSANEPELISEFHDAQIMTEFIIYK